MCQRAMRRGIVCICLVVSCGARCAPPGTIDELAQDYVLLALALDRHDPDFVDVVSPTGKFDWSLNEIVTRAARARERVRTANGDDGRRVFLAAQLAAVERRARWRRGERDSIRQDALALGLKLPAFDAARVAALRADLERTIGGTGPLSQRLARAQRETAVPRSVLDETFRRAIDECRTRTARHLRVPESRLEVRYVIERPWLAYTTYEAGGRGIVEVRRDVPLSEEDLLGLACHEAYPGHHLQNLVWDKELFHERNWVEFSLTPLFTPHGIMAERAASAAGALALPEATRSPVRRFLDALAPHALAVAVAHVDGEIDRDTALRRLRDELLMPQPGQFLDFVARYRAYAAAYVAPDAPFRTWAEYESLLVSPEKLVQGAAQ